MGKRTPSSTKRPRNSGTYTRRGESWLLVVRDRDGKRRGKSVRVEDFPTETAAREALSDFQAEVRREEVPAAGRKPTVEEVAHEWLAHKQRIKRDLAEATVDSLEWAVRHVVRRWGPRKVATVTKGHQVEELFAQLMDDGLGPKSIREISSALHGILKYAHARDYVRCDATRFVEVRPRVPQKPVDAPSDADVAAFVEAMFAYSHAHGVHLVLSAALGARRAEVLALRPVDLDPERDEVRLVRNVVKVRRKDAAGKGETRAIIKDVMKTEAGRRTVTIPAGVMELVLEHVANLDATARELGLKGWPADALLFTKDPLGYEPFHPDSINARFRRVARRAGIAAIAPHQLRHYAATVLSPHMTPSEMRGRFGWRSDQMVARYSTYRRTTDDVAAKLMGVALGEVVPITAARKKLA